MKVASWEHCMAVSILAGAIENPLGRDRPSAGSGTERPGQCVPARRSSGSPKVFFAHAFIA